MTHETAGDPVSGLKWTHRTTAKLAHELRGLGIHVCPQTVARLLKAMGYSLRVNHKKLAGASHPNRDQQFRYITELRERCAADNLPVISVDTKKKELVGAFRNPGAKWDRSPELVNDHDFPSDAEGLAIPYGIYDPRANAGTVFVGRTADTPAFAVDCIEKWWRTEGRKHYPQAQSLQILADGGGSNSSTARAWKFNLQHRLCNRHGLRVTVAHYPPATSKWNPIEHRLFCEISKNWAGRPLDCYETILNYLRTTRTSTGLRVRAHLVRKTYKTGVKVTDAQMRELPHHSEPRHAEMELHHRTHLAKKRNLFLRRPQLARGTRHPPRRRHPQGLRRQSHSSRRRHPASARQRRTNRASTATRPHRTTRDRAPRYPPCRTRRAPAATAVAVSPHLRAKRSCRSNRWERPSHYVPFTRATR